VDRLTDATALCGALDSQRACLRSAVPSARDLVAGKDAHATLRRRIRTDTSRTGRTEDAARGEIEPLAAEPGDGAGPMSLVQGAGPPKAGRRSFSSTLIGRTRQCRATDAGLYGDDRRHKCIGTRVLRDGGKSEDFLEKRSILLLHTLNPTAAAPPGRGGSRR
jgi:hypothetical protein